MRKIAVIIVLASLLCPALALADEISVKGMPPYAGAVITAVEKGFISFRLAAGNVLTRPITDVERVQITGIEAFNKAEKAVSAKEPDFPGAVQAYDGITDLESRAWLKRLVQYRRLKALDQSEQFARAVNEWLSLAKEEKDAVAPFVPTRVAKKGSPDNTKAIAALEGQRESAEAGSAIHRAMSQALMAAYRAEGQTDKADDLAAELAGGAARPRAGKGVDEPKKGDGGKAAVGDGELAATIQAAETLIRPDQKPDLLQKSVKSLQDNLKRYNEGELPRVLFLLGKAQILLAEQAPAAEKKPLYLQGALNCMRVVSHWPDAVEAADALLLAGKAHQDGIGNKQAAKLAYQQVMAQYKGTDAAKEAARLAASLR